MGKKIKKKTRNPHKERRVSSTSHETTPTLSNPQAEIGDNGVLELKERKLCTHVDKSVDLSKISLKIRSLESVKCEDCREGALDRRESKGRSKHGKKKGTSQGGLRSDSKSVWICLECGHLACGGIGLPTAPQSHSLRHARHSHHHCVIQFHNPHLRWCFPCNSLIFVGKAEEGGEQKDVFLEIVKLIKGKSSEGASMDIEDVWFGNGNSGDVAKIKNAESQLLDRKSVHVVRGLVNLGNTCFFNSVLQNILAVEQLRDFFIELDHSVGPLTMALKNLFNETSVETDLRSPINPGTLFGCICVKAPQFRGYQQQDSHELLRYLLDGLHTEELGARKLLDSSEEDKDSGTSNHCPTLVDAIFGGQLSSTVCCVECGHSSVVYEPFLDLSLPVPTKKSPSKKKAQSVSRSKKAKLPLKKEVNKGGKSRLKGKTDITPVLAQCATSSAEGENSLCQPPSSVVVKEDAVGSLDEISWLDYIGADEASNDIDSGSQNCESIIPGCENKEDVALNSLDLQIQSCFPKEELKPDSGGSWENSFVEEELPLQVKDSEVLLLPYKEESLTAEVMCIDDGASSSVVGCGQDTVDFDGLGDLFNEPEIASSTNTETGLYDKNILDDDAMRMASPAGKSSDSDSDEVDDTDAPVSINSCLVYFTKPELLSNEHAWHCENCSKILRDQQMERRKTNGGQSRSRTALLDFGIVSTESRNLVNGTRNGSRIDAESLVAHTDKLDNSIPCYPKNEINSLVEERNSEVSEIMSNCQPDVPHGENDIVQSDYVPQEVSMTMGPFVSRSQVSFDDQVSDACCGKEPDTIGSNVDQVQKSTRIHKSNETKEVKANFVKAMRDATKMILINSAPQILTIHLKRFSQDARGRLSKLSGHVGFCDTLDLRPYMDPRSNNKSSCDYRLVGVVEHSGTMRGGHYVAYVRGGKCRGKTEKEGGSLSMWFYASDSYVREVSLAEVLHCEAYILFYERV